MSFCSTSRDRGPATVRPTIDKREHLEAHGAGLGQVVEEPPRMVHLGGLRTEQEELVGADARHGELADDPPLRVQHRRQVGAADLAAACW